MTRLLRWICDPAKLEAIEGDLAELYGDRRSWRYAIDVMSVPERDLVQTGDTLIIRGGDHGADFYIAIKPEGGIEWYPRHSFSR